MKYTAKNMLEFIDKSPSPFHTVDNISEILLNAGFTRLYEQDRWETCEGGKYFVVKNSSSIIAFVKGSEDSPFMICASHSDFPAFKVKSENAGVYARLSTERYGGMLMYSWFDRPLSVAGRVMIREGEAVTEKLVNIDKDLLVIPSVAIHMQRNANDGFSPNAAVDMLPLFSIDKNAKLASVLSEECGVKEEDIISHDLFLYTRQKGSVIGADSELFLSPRIDNLECVYTSLTSFLDSDPTKSTKVFAVFNNEEVGSETKQGAASPFLATVLERLSKDREGYFAAIAKSFMVSADNAHAKHPAHPELADSVNGPILGGGVVIKHNANQRYATDAVSSALFGEICLKAGAKVQQYSNRADMIGGSTLGSISNTKVPIPTVDIGLAQLAMHSAVETAALSDASDMVKALTAFYSSELEIYDTKFVLK